MKIAVAADHAGFPLKATLLDCLTDAGLEVEDLGAATLDPTDDYPDFAERVARAVHEGRAQRGLILCGSGVGVSIAANKFPGVRAAMCHDTYSARQGVEHDDMNVLCIGARVIGPALAVEVARSFAAARFSGDARHARRLQKVLEIERRHLRSP